MGHGRQMKRTPRARRKLLSEPRAALQPLVAALADLIVADLLRVKPKPSRRAKAPRAS
jgi:hypothetical protein